jgi:hypothetical protein
MVNDEKDTMEEPLKKIVHLQAYHLRRAKDAKRPSLVLVSREGIEEAEFRPPEATFRLGIRYDSRENYQKFGHISHDYRYILTDDGDVYLLVDEESLNIQSHHENNFRVYQGIEHQSTDARRSDLGVLLGMILESGIAPSAQARLIRWLVCGRLGAN